MGSLCFLQRQRVFDVWDGKAFYQHISVTHSANMAQTICLLEAMKVYTFIIDKAEKFHHFLIQSNCKIKLSAALLLIMTEISGAVPPWAFGNTRETRNDF